MKFKPMLRSKKLTTTSQTYVKVLKLSIGKPSRLHRIEVLSDNDAKTKWKISINPTTYEEFEATTPKKFSFPHTTNLEVGDEILIEARSTDGTSITLDAHITGVVEREP